jgi:hypothetical protein
MLGVEDIDFCSLFGVFGRYCCPGRGVHGGMLQMLARRIGEAVLCVRRLAFSPPVCDCQLRLQMCVVGLASGGFKN